LHDSIKNKIRRRDFPRSLPETKKSDLLEDFLMSKGYPSWVQRRFLFDRQPLLDVRTIQLTVYPAELYSPKRRLRGIGIFEIPM